MVEWKAGDRAMVEIQLIAHGDHAFIKCKPGNTAMVPLAALRSLPTALSAEDAAVIDAAVAWEADAMDINDACGRLSRAVRARAAKSAPVQEPCTEPKTGATLSFAPDTVFVTPSHRIYPNGTPYSTDPTPCPAAPAQEAEMAEEPFTPPADQNPFEQIYLALEYARDALKYWGEGKTGMGIVTNALNEAARKWWEANNRPHFVASTSLFVLHNALFALDAALAPPNPLDLLRRIVLAADNIEDPHVMDDVLREARAVVAGEPSK